MMMKAPIEMMVKTQLDTMKALYILRLSSVTAGPELFVGGSSAPHP